MTKSKPQRNMPRRAPVAARGARWLRACLFSAALAALALSFSACDDLGGSAAWATYTIVYHSNDGRYLTLSSNQSFGVSHRLKDSAFYRVGFTFNGWATSSGLKAEPSFAAGQSVSGMARNAGDTIHLFAVWRQLVFTARFCPNSGTFYPNCYYAGYIQHGNVVKELTFEPGGRLPDVRLESPSDYFFAGWAIAPGGPLRFVRKEYMEYLLENLELPSGNGGDVEIKLYAWWSPSEYFSITYDFNGGHGIDSHGAHIGAEHTEDVEAGHLTRLPNQQGLRPDVHYFLKDGHGFLGWNDERDGSGQSFAPGDRFVSGADATLYAQWLPIGTAFDIAFSANGAFGEPPFSRSVSAAYGLDLPGAGYLSMPGYFFIGWSKLPSGTGEPIFPAGFEFRPTAAATLYARWHPVGGAPHDIAWTAIASGAPYTTAIHFAFDAPVLGLTQASIYIASGSGAAHPTAGGLTDEFGGRVWRLALDSASSGSVTVSISMPGVSAASQSLTVSGPAPGPIIITWAASAYAAPHTVAINFLFSHPVSGLTRGDIQITDGTGSVTSALLPGDPLSGGGTTWSLPVAVTGDGNVTVSINMPPIDSAPRVVAVRANIITSATALGTSASDYISLEFRDAVTALEGYVHISNGTGEADLLVGAPFGGGGTAWSLPISATGAGSVYVQVTAPGVDQTPWPVTVAVPPANGYIAPTLAAVAAGGSHTLAIIRDGELWAWGNNASGQLGDGTTAGRSTPVRIGYPDANWRHVSAGWNHTAAIKVDGSLWAWGNNENGELGIGNSQPSHYPVRIGYDNDWAYVSAGEQHTVALRRNGALYAWGSPWAGRLGFSANAIVTAPQRMGMGYWKHVSAGESHTLGVMRDGTLWGWGSNLNGRLGDGTTTQRIMPVPIGNYAGWKRVSTHQFHTMAIRQDGTLWAWGSNLNGRLGLGIAADGEERLTPYLVEGDGWIYVSAGELHTVGVRQDGTLWAWGSNADWRLGSTAVGNPSLSPSRITGTSTDWAFVSTGSAHAVAVRAGNVWTWGCSADGKLGGVPSAPPQQVIFPAP